MIRDRLLEILKDGAKSNRELIKLMPDKSMRVISATISNNKGVFLRLEKGLVGLVGRDEHLVTGRRIHYEKFCLYKKLTNLLIDREKRLEELYDALPDEKKVSIRASITLHPETFFRIKRGVIGRRGRDEYLIDKYARRSTKVKIKRETIADKLTLILLNGEKSLQEIHHLIPQYPLDSITCKLSLHDKFVRVGKGRWGLKRN